jgi:hypothetical protein
MDFAFLSGMVGKADGASTAASGAPQVALTGEDQYVPPRSRELIEAFFGCRWHHGHSAHAGYQRPESSHGFSSLLSLLAVLPITSFASLSAAALVGQCSAAGAIPPDFCEGSIRPGDQSSPMAKPWPHNRQSPFHILAIKLGVQGQSRKQRGGL